MSAVNLLEVELILLENTIETLKSVSNQDNHGKTFSGDSLTSFRNQSIRQW